MSPASYYTKLHNHLQSIHLEHALSIEAEHINNAEWRIAVKINGAVKGEGRATRKHDAQELAAVQALRNMGVPVRA